MKKNTVLYALLLALLTSCVVVPVMPQYTGINPYYAGSGEGYSFLEALNQAKANVLRLAVIDLIGETEEMQNRSKLYSVFYTDTKPNAYLETDYMRILRRGETYRGYYCEITVPVKIDAIRKTLDMIGTYSAKGGNILSSSEVRDAKTKSELQGNNVGFITQYVDSMLYMVVPNQKAKDGNTFSKSAVNMANKYLLDNGYRAVDYAAVEALKSDSSSLFAQEPETADLSVVQWIAQKLGADVYIEVDGFVQGGRETGGYYGQAEVNLKMYNPSTGELLGAVPYSSPKTFDRGSTEAAAQNAIKSTVFKAMSVAVDQAKKALVRDYAQGIRYEITINNTPDSKLMSNFRNELQRKVEAIRVVHQSAAQTKYAVQYFGRVEDMENIVYSTAESVTGMEKISLVMIRGKTLMFRLGR
ncbi:hypothetical protein ABK01_05090 [Treponema sp. OMZ 305]|uniref:hypothetical protein n=1 Tax=Treponema sp. OMZ 305 TaxID=1659192 RepID=UPI0020A244EC|nr:hypothetical protein [Treponema sp. OMZ 305]UTC57696.1 hypothetical protein ABK01_05090 [Treponema sp. OMZ 305]